MPPATKGASVLVTYGLLAEGLCSQLMVYSLWETELYAYTLELM